MIDPHNRPVLGDDSLRLRAPVAGDVAARLALGRSAEIVHMFGVPKDDVQPITRSEAEDWVEAQLREPLAFVIEQNGRMIGALRLHSVDMTDRRASLAIALLDETLLGRGIGTRAISMILEHAFGAMGLHRIAIRVIDYNSRAIACYTKLGFVKEGREREAAKVGETFHDDIMMGLLASEWGA